ncbi:MAG: glycosyltransferase [Candidatus Doudnabacteria bacterium]|nr:glycosyltransferase [Candidatus Doudnabacteria bacterium]
MKKNLVSVITPTWNRGETFLPRTIESVQRQLENSVEHEHIIVDNASSDNTRKVVREYAKKDPRIKYIRSPKNVKASGALNIGFKASKGSFIYPLDDDDCLLPYALENFYDEFVKSPKVEWMYGVPLIIDANDVVNFRWRWPNRYYPTPKQMFWNLMKADFICNGTVMMRRSAVAKVKGWDLTLASQDYTMWLKLAYAGLKHKQLRQYVLFYRQHDKRESNKNAVNGVWAGVRQYLLKKFNTTEEEIVAKTKS